MGISSPRSTIIHREGVGDGRDLLLMQDDLGQYAIEWERSTPSPWNNRHETIRWAVWDIRVNPYHPEITPMAEFVLKYFPEEEVALVVLTNL